jgi:hypothetical protein
VSESEQRTGQDWSAAERESALDIYFRMYELEHRGEPYVRKRLYESFVARYPHRSVKALEYKLQNVSACLL